MPPELDPLRPGAARPRVAEPEAAPGTERALSGSGMGTGRGTPSIPTVLRQLSRRPAEGRKAGVDDLNGRVGNRRVSRMIAAERPPIDPSSRPPAQ
jgi:hypothetical protein